MDVNSNLRRKRKTDMDERIDLILDRACGESRVDNALAVRCLCGWEFSGDPIEALELSKSHRSACDISGKSSAGKRRSKKFALTDEIKVRSREGGLQAVNGAKKK